ncbi:cytochrome c oxidase accessory protein CcoG [Campylobacter corcagiensis]|uniref:Cytochrome c oxidase accessory protein CcoG n=1 Tax=Campylobacter corcagiensis TaxID=1448857 RepID=A0A7M1LGV6_9BACT|nr:cytochrome c oxidase accessory protein CcoG [Campylobacter corcagiensis]QKF63966.1 cytochrome c oxidase accessory protein [Campylobacter corcagiensis]QOQ87832.1 cytochrome c oxidase accessory protein CcoG [Campylobacter corcagiensis]
MYNYAKKRYISFSIIMILAFVLPFIRINGNHIFLLSFDRKELHLFFQAFSTQELFLLPFLLILCFVGIFFITSLGGRVWCGWACPQTTFRVFYRDFIQTKLLGIRRSIKNKQVQPKSNIVKKAIGFIIWVVISLIVGSNFMWYFIPPEDFFRYLANPSEHLFMIGIVVGIALFLVLDIVFIKENFCVYICPYARIQSVMFDKDTFQVIYDEKRGGKIYDDKHNLIANKPTGEGDECIGCRACINICPTHIDIRKGMQLECINCLECADACSGVMGKLGKISLINWTSENAVETRSETRVFRPKTIGYMAFLSLIFVVLLLVGASRDSLLLNINRDSGLYNIRKTQDSLVVENDYVFLIENTHSKDGKFYFKVDSDLIKIKRPKDEFTVNSGKKEKVIVTLVMNASSIEAKDDDIKIPIKVKAYAVENEDEINVVRDSVFIFPKNEQLKRYKK